MSTGQKAKKLAGGLIRLQANYGMGQLSGVSQGLLGTDFGARKMFKVGDDAQYSNTGAAGVPQAQPEYTTNIDPNTGEEINSPLTMSSKPLKELTNIQGTTPYNKSANEHKSGLTMNKIAMSGISSKY